IIHLSDEKSAYPPHSGWLAGLGRLKDGYDSLKSLEKTRLSRELGESGVSSALLVTTCFPFYAACNTRALKRSKFARPYICRLIVFSRLTCPSIGPLLQGNSSAAASAAYSWCSLTAKCRSSTTAHCSASSNQVGNAATACSCISCRNVRASSRTIHTSTLRTHKWAGVVNLFARVQSPGANQQVSPKVFLMRLGREP